MWAIVKDNKVVEVISSPKPVIIDEIQHPKRKTPLFISWTDEERKAIGVVPYVYEGDSVNAMFYTSSESSPVISSDKGCCDDNKNCQVCKFGKDRYEGNCFFFPWSQP